MTPEDKTLTICVMWAFALTFVGAAFWESKLTAFAIGSWLWGAVFFIGIWPLAAKAVDADKRRQRPK